MLISHFLCCSSSLDLFVSTFNRDSIICSVEETFWSGFQWTEVSTELKCPLNSYLHPQLQSVRDMVATVCLVGGWVGGRVNQHFQVEAMCWRIDLSVGGDSGVWGRREVLMMAIPCPIPAPDEWTLPSPSSVHILPLIKDPDTIFEEI